MDKKEQFESLRVELNRTKNWPLVYMFKFIFPADSKKQALVESKFSDDSVISQNTSANGKYISITVKEVMLDADSIINKYIEVSEIEGVMSF
ncbi:MAG TPA: DUF493 domain-containing protein [Bacteroidia bacterium]|jgi:hypothetical protein|nr:DUF493 domain-containing protein [Bacteroidia bacterium]HQW22443.1 DUF493 domain-containing protein [Bacteroidia bacterium]